VDPKELSASSSGTFGEALEEGHHQERFSFNLPNNFV
jgi:hypothetical protein